MTAWPAVTAMLISIHALREEGDKLTETRLRLNTDFYPRPPRGGRLSGLSGSSPGSSFLSTPSARRATFVFVLVMVDESRFLSTPSARRATWKSQHWQRWAKFLSTPSARRATGIKPGKLYININFYPRPPRGGRRCRMHEPLLQLSISIHALREEGDKPKQRNAVQLQNFYPRPPRGGRPAAAVRTMSRMQFLSTPSARRATQQTAAELHRVHISIHALREEGDVGLAADTRRDLISIHALREEGDSPSMVCFSTNSYFYPRPPRGGRQQKQRQNLYFQTNYTTFCTNLEEP